MKNIIY